MAQQATQLRPGRARAGAQLRVSSYDQAASLLIALLTLVGTVVFCLFVIWVTNQIFTSQTAVPVVLQELGGGAEDGVLGESVELDAPESEVIAMEADFEEPLVQDTLELVADAVASRQAELDDPMLSEFEEAGQRSGRSTGDGREVGQGHGAGEPGISRAERWEVIFSEGQTLEKYAAQLDFFEIELGIVRRDGAIEYASHMSRNKPDKRRGESPAEKRLFMSWSRGSLNEADRELLAKAGIDGVGGRILQFYPPNTENQLATLERAFAGREAHEIRKTRFGVRAERAGYRFYVLDQSYL